MSNEQQGLLNEVYEKYLKYTINGIETGLDKIKGYLDNCLVEYDGYYEHFTNPSFVYGYRTHNQQEFINKIKTDEEFSGKWGLKIEERELVVEERVKWAYDRKLIDYVTMVENEILDKHNIPTKLITITYKKTIIESYES